MQKIDLPIKKLEEILAKELKRPVKIATAEKISSGFVSDGYKLVLNDGACYFIKRFKSSDLSGYNPDIQFSSYVLSNSMMERSGLQGYVVVQNGGEVERVPSVNDQSVLYHIQPFHNLPSQNYWSQLEARKERKKIGEEERKEIRMILHTLGKIHGGPLSKEVNVRTQLYNEGLQAVLGPIFFFFLHDLPREHHVFPHELHGDYIGKMLSLIHEFKDREDRLRTLHGDFWGGNVFFDFEQETMAVIDFSRIPFGDPAFDVAYWLAQYLWFYCATGNDYFRELGELFLTEYEKRFDDREIRKIITLPFGLLALVYLSPKIFPNTKPETEKMFFSFIQNSLHRKKFDWQ